MKYLGDYDVNINETLRVFYIPLSATFNLKGVKAVKVRTSGNEKLWKNWKNAKSKEKIIRKIL